MSTTTRLCDGYNYHLIWNIVQLQYVITYRSISRDSLTIMVRNVLPIKHLCFFMYFFLVVSASESQQFQNNLSENHTTNFLEENNTSPNVPTSYSHGDTSIDFDNIIDAFQQSRSHASTSHVLALIFTTNDDEGIDKNFVHWERHEQATEWSRNSVDQMLYILHASEKSILVKRFVLDTSENSTKASNNCGDDDVAPSMDAFAFGSMNKSGGGIDEVARPDYKEVDVEQKKLSDGIDAKVENADCANSRHSQRRKDDPCVR